MRDRMINSREERVCRYAVKVYMEWLGTGPGVDERAAEYGYLSQWAEDEPRYAARVNRYAAKRGLSDFDWREIAVDKEWLARRIVGTITYRYETYLWEYGTSSYKLHTQVIRETYDYEEEAINEDWFCSAVIWSREGF